MKHLCSPAIDAAIAAIVRAATDAAGDLATLHDRCWAGAARAIKAATADLVLDLIASLTPAGDYLQRSPNLRIHLPGGETAIPFHSDTLYGHAAEETNYWLTLTPAFASNSLWMCGDGSGLLHERLRSGESLADFQKWCERVAAPVVTQTPALYSFCCSQVHGSMPNTTGQTRVSFDIRTIPASAKSGSKSKSGYFRPLWLTPGPCPLASGDKATTIASLDLGTRVDHQRQVMDGFWPQSGNRELVEFHGLDHAPTIADAMGRGPVVLYSVRQLRAMADLVHPVGLADDRCWFVPGQEELLHRMIAECRI